MKKTTAYLLMSIGLALPAGAQTLSEEIVIDREITPVVRPATRPTWVTPTLLTPRSDNRTLSFYEYTGVAELTRSIAPLDPVEWADSVMRSPYRGYASLGYFPVYNLNAAAGYRFLHNSRMDAGAHFSYDGSSWSGNEEAETKFRRNELKLGADATMRWEAGRLDADFNYTYSSATTARYNEYINSGTQAINMVGLNLRWTPNHVSKFEWDIAANLGYGGFSKARDLNFPSLYVPYVTHNFKPVKDVTFGFGSDLAYNLSDISGIALGLNADFRHVSDFSTIFGSEGSKTLGIIALRPGYTFVSGKISGRLGLRVDINTGGSHTKAHFAPDIDVRWAPSSVVAIYAHAKGGEVMNSNTQLWERNPWMTGTFSSERSHVNADIELGITYGSFKGFWANAHGGWSSVSDWAAPIFIDTFNSWALRNSFNGFNIGAELGYSWRNFFTIVGHIDAATHRRYYRWQDNAKWSFDIAAKIRPIDRLQIEVGYDSRLSRQGFSLFTTPATDESISYFTKLGSTSNLYAGADYEVTSALGVFLKVEDILNKHWYLVPGVRSQGIRGLLGVQYKF